MPKADFLPADVSDIEVFTVDDSQQKHKTDSETKTDALAQALADDENAFVSIHLQENGREIFAERIPADKFDYGQIQTYLKEKYGGGDFRVRLYANGKLRQNKLLEILKQKEHVSDKTDGMAGVISQLISRMDRQDQALNAILQNHNNNQNNEMEFLQKMQIYKSLFDNNSQQIDPMAQLQSTMSVLQNMGVQLGGIGQTIEHEQEPGFGELIEKFTPLMEVALSSQMQKPSKYKQNPIDDQKRAQMMKWKQGVSFLINGAKAKADPGMYAEMVIGQVGANGVKTFVSAGEAGAEKFRAMFPETTAHIEWFKLLFEHLKAQLGMPSSVDSEYDDLTVDIESSNDVPNSEQTVTVDDIEKQ